MTGRATAVALALVGATASAAPAGGIVLDGAGSPISGATVLASDEGCELATAVSGPDGRFAFSDLPEGALTFRAIAPSGAAVVVARVAPDAPDVELSVGIPACYGFVDLPDPRVLVKPEFLASWHAEPLAPRCPQCPAYRWFWERRHGAQLLIRVDYLDGVAHLEARAWDGGRWTSWERALTARRSRRLDDAITRSGFWQLEHLDLGTMCHPPGTEWTVEGVASPGYRAVHRVAPARGPLGTLGWELARDAGIRVRRKTFE